MSYLLKSRSDRTARTRTTRVAVATVTFALLILLLNATRPSILSGLFSAIGRPFWILENATGNGFSNFFSYFTSKQKLEAENATLRNELEGQSLAMQNFNDIEKENEQLKNTLGRTDKKSLVLATVLQGPGISPYDTFVLDVGRSENIQVGQSILLDGVLPIGTIVEVDQNTSLARLYSAPDQQINVRISPSQSLVLATGEGNGNFRVTVPRSMAVSTTTQVFLPNIANEALGSVDGEDTDIAHATQTLYFRFDANLGQVRSVYVDTGSAPAIYSAITATSTSATPAQKTTTR